MGHRQVNYETREDTGTSIDSQIAQVNLQLNISKDES